MISARQRSLALAAFALVSAALLAPSVAYAGKYDLEFSSFRKADTSLTGVRTVTIDNAGFSSLMRELAFAMGPRAYGPAASGGALGFDVGFEMSFAGINGSSAYWTKGTNSASSGESSVTTTQLRVRKGLPFSMELGGSLTHLLESNLWGIGVEMKWSLVDGFAHIPDISLRPMIQTVLGNDDIAMLILGGDFTISKSFGVGGLLALEPWISYSALYTYVTTHQISVPLSNGVSSESFLFKQVSDPAETSHRIGGGLRVVVTRLSFGFEFLRSLTQGLNIVTGKVGLAF